MFVLVLIANIAVAFVVSGIVALIFRRPIDRILDRLVGEEISEAWAKYLVFAIYVVGVSGGVRTWMFERHLPGMGKSGAEAVPLTANHLALYT